MTDEITLPFHNNTQNSGRLIKKETENPPAQGYSNVSRDQQYKSSNSSRVLKASKPDHGKSAVGFLDRPNPFLQWPTHMLQQPSNAAMIEEILVSRLISETRPLEMPGQPKSWIVEVPRILSQAQLPALRYAVRAAAMAYHTKRNPHPGAEGIARQWYVASLSCHRAFLCATSEQKLDDLKYGRLIPGVEELLIPIFLCLFEMFSTSTPAAVLQHRAACCRVLEIMGPENCQEGVSHQVFKSMRLSDACLVIMMGKRSIFESSIWATVPFQQQPKPMTHQLVDIMIKIPAILTSCTGRTVPLHMIESYIRSLDHGYDLLADECLSMLQDLDEWWRQFEEDTYVLGLRELSPNLVHPETFRTSGKQFSPMMYIYRDISTAHTVAVYNSTNVILHMILNVLASNNTYSPRSLEVSHTDLALSHCTSIILMAEHQERTCPPGFDFMRSTFTLKVVAALSPYPGQRAKAASLIKMWSIRKDLTISTTMG